MRGVADPSQVVCVCSADFCYFTCLISVLSPPKKIRKKTEQSGKQKGEIKNGNVEQKKQIIINIYNLWDGIAQTRNTLGWIRDTLGRLVKKASRPAAADLFRPIPKLFPRFSYVFLGVRPNFAIFSQVFCTSQKSKKTKQSKNL